MILAHLHCQKRNQAITEAALAELKGNRHQVAFHGLQAESFDPILSVDELPKEASLPPAIERHCQETRGSEGIIFGYRNWLGAT